MITILSKQEVKKEMGVIPGEIADGYYIKTVDGRNTTYHNVDLTTLLQILSKNN